MNHSIPFLWFITTPLELISFVLAALSVVLTIRQNHWAWLFSILSSATYAAVFFDSKIYGDMGLQLVFIAASVWGWYQWLRGGIDHQAPEVSCVAGSWRWLSIAGWLAGFVLISLFLKSFTDTDVPHIDGFLTAGSLLGQLLLARKKLENWHVWIIVDVLYVGLYIYKNLMLTAILYALFTVMAISGLRVWRKSMKKSESGITSTV